jgi:hypothetical protein
MELLHKVLPARVNNKTLKSIADNGLIPQLPSEYKMSLPVHLQEVPIVWLAERMNTIDGVIFSVDIDKLDKKRLHNLGWEDVCWWVYEGIIPVGALATIPIIEEG